MVKFSIHTLSLIASKPFFYMPHEAAVVASLFSNMAASTSMATLSLHKHLLLLLLLATTASSKPAIFPAPGEFWPAEPTRYRLFEPGSHDSGGRRQLVPFQLCLLCRCCAANLAGNCTTMPCCFGIDCQLPNKPFGVCAFVPTACGCTACDGE